MGCSKNINQTGVDDNNIKKMNLFFRLLLYMLVIVLSPLITVAILFMMFKHIVLAGDGVSGINNAVISVGKKINDKRNNK